MGRIVDLVVPEGRFCDSFRSFCCKVVSLPVVSLHHKVDSLQITDGRDIVKRFKNTYNELQRERNS